MPQYLNPFVAAAVLALSGSATLAATCPDLSPWGNLGPPAFTVTDDCAMAIGLAPLPRDFEFSVVSIYAGTRFMTADAAPAPFGYRYDALRRTDRSLASPPPLSFDALGDWADAPTVPDALALLLAGFLGIGLAVRRRGRAS